MAEREVETSYISPANQSEFSEPQEELVSLPSQKTQAKPFQPQKTQQRPVQSKPSPALQPSPEQAEFNETERPTQATKAQQLTGQGKIPVRQQSPEQIEFNESEQMVEEDLSVKQPSAKRPRFQSPPPEQHDPPPGEPMEEQLPATKDFADDLPPEAFQEEDVVLVECSNCGRKYEPVLVAINSSVDSQKID